MKHLTIIFLILLSFSCSEEDSGGMSTSENLYFPPVSGNEWETDSAQNLDWNLNELNNLKVFLEDQNSRAFIILYKGRIVVEEYWGNNLLNTAPFTESTNWYWASAGKGLTAALVGIAQEEGLLSIDDPTSDYLGSGWTSLDTENENAIKIVHQLTMTTGLDYTVNNLNCTDPGCLSYLSPPGELWYYHNAPYTLLGDVLASASGSDINTFTNSRIEDKIGMSGQWIKSSFNSIYWSTARDAARFGLLVANDGIWNEEVIYSGDNYFNQMISTSQTLNPAYGYLWWLNGKSSIIYPGLAQIFNTSLAPDAPPDLYAALGKNGQVIDIVPSQDLVVVRLGDNPDESLVPIEFHNEMWKIINRMVK